MSNTTNIYWAPVYEYTRDNHIDWNILYPEPEILYDSLRSQKTDTKEGNVFYCPAFKNFTSNTFVFKNPMNADFYVHENYDIESHISDYVTVRVEHQPSIKNRIMVEYKLRWIFFAEDDNIDISLTSPYFDHPEHLQYGSIIPARFSISNWFRPVNTEFMLKESVREFKMKKDEPLFYASFNTNKNVKLIRFDMNEKLRASSMACSTSSRWESWVPLSQRYNRFKESRMRGIILKEIRNNLVE